MLRMLPAQQRLKAVHVPRSHVDLGLVVQQELLLVQGFLDAAYGQRAFFGAAAVLGVEEQVAIATGLLGAVHGVVGVAQQGVGVAAVNGVDRGAHAGGDLHGVLQGVHHIGLRHHAQHPFYGQACLFKRARAQQHHKLVAAQASSRVGPVFTAAQRTSQPAGQFSQQPVARSVPEAVIDRLEAVEVQVAHHQQVAVAVGRAHGIHQQF